jgi:hypothetical protein
VINDQCTTGKQRRITHWEHEDVLEAVQQRLNEHPEKMHQRRETVERPFGIIKCWVEFTYFQMKTLKHVGTETALHVLAHNLKRGMKIISIVPLAFGAPTMSGCHVSFGPGFINEDQPLRHNALQILSDVSTPGTY